MYRYLSLILLLCTLAFPVSVRAQYYSVNFDTKTVAEMAVAYNTEAAVEIYYQQQTAKIRDHYEAAEIASAGIFASKYLDRKALTNMGLWSSSTENYYYKRIYNMVATKIMPKVWTIACMMVKNPQNALYWGSYLYKVCEETKNLCYQFESIVTNSSLTFSAVTFLEINPELKPFFKLSESGNIDWKKTLDNFGSIKSNFTKESLKKDIDKLYSMGVNLATAGAANMGSSIMGNSNANGDIMSKTDSAIVIVNNLYNMYDNLSNNTASTLMGLVGGRDSVANIFNLSNYNATSWLTDYAREGMGQYYTQKWYIYRVDQGSVVLCDYYPPTDDESVINGDHWTRFDTTDPNFWPNSQQTEQILQNSENHAGYSRAQVNQLNNSNDGFTYRITYYRNGYIISRGGNQKKKAYAYEIHVTKNWYNKQVIYEDVFDSYSMDLNSFKSGMNARLEDYNDNDDGFTYMLGCDSKKYYQATDAQKIAGCQTATISITCHDGAKLGEGNTQYKCSDCGGSVNAHTKQCVMATTITGVSLGTSEIDAKISEAESQIAVIQSQIDALETENSNLIRLISSSSVEEAATYRQQYNANKDRISSLKSEKTQWENQLSQYRQAREEIIAGENAQTDDYYRLPAIMKDCKSGFNLTWNGEGSWQGNTFVRTATMPNINGVITFKADISIARGPKYFLGIKIHRAIVQISWTLTTEYSDTQVVDIIDLDPSKTDAQKADEVNAHLAEIAKEYPDCDASVEYAKSDPVEQDNTEDTYHLLWSSDRLQIARDIDTRLTKIYADLVCLEKMMHYKHSIVDILMSYLPYINDEQGRRLTLLEKCRRRWLRHAAGSMHSDTYNGKYEEDEDE